MGEHLIGSQRPDSSKQNNPVDGGAGRYLPYPAFQLFAAAAMVAVTNTRAGGFHLLPGSPTTTGQRNQVATYRLVKTEAA
jgi:hypothetical protein